jgi:hypothetical protein
MKNMSWTFTAESLPEVGSMTDTQAYHRNGVWVRQTMPGDDRALLANMRKKDVEECKAYGMSPGRALRNSIQSSLYSKSVWLDGWIIAMIGLSGPVISEMGCPWMLTGNGIEKVPFTFAKVAIRELDEMHKYKRILSNYVQADYHEAVRFLSAVGFSIASPREVGKNGVMFHQATRIGD